MKSFAFLLATGMSALAFASAAHAADLVVEGPGPIQYNEPAAGNWDGAYVGVFGGYASGSFGFEDSDDLLDPAGWLLGVNAGANFTLTNGIVAGVVGDIAWTDLNDGEIAGPNSADVNVDWAGSIRGRVGFDGGSFMPYLTAGLAFAHANFDFVTPGPSGSDDQVHVGWTVGAGVEVAVADNVSLDLQYRYSDYGSATYTIGGLPGELDLTAHQVTAGVNVGF